MNVYNLTALFFTAILLFIAKDYYNHYTAFKKSNLITATVLEKEYRRKGADKIKVSYNDQIQFVDVRDYKLENIKLNQSIKLLKAPNGDLYWNTKPNKLVLTLFPILIGFIIYLIKKGISN